MDVDDVLLHVAHVFDRELLSGLDSVLDHLDNSLLARSGHDANAMVVLDVVWLMSVVRGDYVSFGRVERPWKLGKWGCPVEFPVVCGSTTVEYS